MKNLSAIVKEGMVASWGLLHAAEPGFSFVSSKAAWLSSTACPEAMLILFSLQLTMRRRKGCFVLVLHKKNSLSFSMASKTSGDIILQYYSFSH